MRNARGKSIEKFGRIDALINSAFFHGEMDHAATADLEQWEAPMRTNLYGTLKLSQTIIAHMKRQAHGGAVVMINTMAVRQVPPLGEVGYAASKAALATSTKYLANEVGRNHIRVNSVFMGWMWGAPVETYVAWQASQIGKSVEEIKAQIAARIPIGRIPTDEECARAALFMVSDYASAVTGAQLDVNGSAWRP